METAEDLEYGEPPPAPRPSTLSSLTDLRNRCIRACFVTVLLVFALGALSMTEMAKDLAFAAFGFFVCSLLCDVFLIVFELYSCFRYYRLVLTFVSLVG